MGGKAEMNTGGSLPSKHTSALQLAHTCQGESNSGVSWHGRENDEGHANAFCSCMNTNEEHLKSHFAAVYKTPSAPGWASVNTNCQCGGLLPINHQSPAGPDCPLPPFVSPQPRLRALPCARQVSAHLPSKVWGTCRMFPCTTAKKETASCSHWEMTAREFSLQETTDTEMSATFSLKATQCQLPPCSGSCNMGTLHCTAQQRQHRPLEQRKVWGFNPAHDLLVGDKEVSYISLLKISELFLASAPRICWRKDEQALCAIMQTCMFTYKPIMSYACTNSTLC